jgi:hypothetical protein
MLQNKHDKRKRAESIRIVPTHISTYRLVGSDSLRQRHKHGGRRHILAARVALQLGRRIIVGLPRVDKVEQQGLYSGVWNT